MKSIYISIFLLLFISANTLWAQVEEVIVEKYYVADFNDTLRYDGVEPLKEGSVTYRIYVDLNDSNKLIKIYGDENNPLMFSSTTTFFNNTDRGRRFGYEINDNWLDENTVALDTWLTIGLATRDHFGVMKTEDNDGSMVGGNNNENGILTNEDSDAGIPLTTADGLILTDSSILGFSAFAVDDTTIFGETVDKSNFFSTNAVVINTKGILGLTTDNKILVAQLTTDGDLSFKLNLEVETDEGIIKYVSDTVVDADNEVLSRWLEYPPPDDLGGCTDPWFIEFDPDAAYDDGSCNDSIILGCMDITACNYEPTANMDVPEICCYGPQQCDERDIDIVCPGYSTHLGSVEFSIFPNPANQKLNLTLNSVIEEQEANYTIYNSFGVIVMQESFGKIAHKQEKPINISSLEKGIYFIRLQVEQKYSVKTFVKH